MQQQQASQWDFDFKPALDLQESWELYFDAQQQNQKQHREKFTADKPTVHPYSPFDACADAEALRKAMKGIGTDEEAIINILTKRSSSQRQEIILKYQQIHGRCLMKDLKSEVSGDLEKVLVSLLKPLPLFLAEQICRATKGAGTAEDVLIEILCTRDCESLKSIKSAFHELTDKSIEVAICKETSGSFEKTLMSVLTACREDSTTSAEDVASELCQEDVSEDIIRKVIVSYTSPFLRKVFEEYSEKSGDTFDKLVQAKCSGYTEKAFIVMYKCINCTTEYYAEALHEAMAGAGTADCALIRLIVSRCEIDLGTIKQKYFNLYEKNLLDDIMSEVSGDYQKALVCLVEDLK